MNITPPKNPRKLMMQIFLVAAAIILFFWAVNNFDQITGAIGWFFGIISPFIGGFVIAYLLSMPVNGIQKLLNKIKLKFIPKISRGVSIALVYLIIVALLYVAIILLVPPVVSSVVDLVTGIPAFVQQFMTFISEVNREGRLPFYVDLEEIFTLVVGAVPMDIAYDIIMTQLGALLGSVTFIFNGLIALISSIYILSESNKIIKFVKRVIKKIMPKKASDVTRVYVRKTHNYFKKYINCVLIDCLAMGIVAPIVLLILGSPHALTLGLLLGVMNFIPVFGSIFATLIAIIVILLTQGLEMGIIAAIVLLVIQRIDADIFQPRLYGNSLRLSPLLVIISITVGGAIGNAISGFGGMVIGMFIAIPCMKIISNIVEDVLGIEDASDSGDAVSGDGIAPADGDVSDAPGSEPAKEKSAFVQWIRKLNRPIGRKRNKNS